MAGLREETGTRYVEDGKRLPENARPLGSPLVVSARGETLRDAVVDEPIDERGGHDSSPKISPHSPNPLVGREHGRRVLTAARQDLKESMAPID